MIPVKEETLPSQALTAHRRVELLSLSDIRPENVQWAWADRVALHMTNLIYGIEGRGKGLLGAHLIAMWTRGELPGRFEGEPIRVLMAVGEDALANVVAPRLLAAGADPRRVDFVTINERGNRDQLVLPRDAEILGDKARDAEAKVLWIDPLLPRLDGDINTFKAHEVRKALEPLQEAAERHGFAPVGVMHLNKGGSHDPRQRAQNSTAFRELARSTMVLGRDPDDPDPQSQGRILAFDKANLTGFRPSQRMIIEPVTLTEKDRDGREIQTARATFDGLSEYTAIDVLRAEDPNTDSSGGMTKIEQAEKLLTKMLSPGVPTDSEPIKLAAEAMDISDKTLGRARTNLGVIAHQEHRPGKSGSSSRWERPLPLIAD